MIEINDPTAESIPKDEPSPSRGGKYNLRPNLVHKCSEIYRYWRVQKFIQAPFRMLFSISNFFLAHTSLNFFIFLVLGQSEKNTNHQQKQQYNNKQSIMNFP